MYSQEVHGNNYSKLLIRSNQWDTVIVTASNGIAIEPVHLEFTERWKVCALINILTQFRDETWKENGEPLHLYKENTDG